MKFFVDTAEIDAIAELHALGMVDGVTTNPSLIMKSGRDMIEVIKEICDLVPGPVSAEVATFLGYDLTLTQADADALGVGELRAAGPVALGPESLIADAAAAAMLGQLAIMDGQGECAGDPDDHDGLLTWPVCSAPGGPRA